MFVGGMKQRTHEGMESKLLRSTHRTVKHGETLIAVTKLPQRYRDFVAPSGDF